MRENSRKQHTVNRFIVFPGIHLCDRSLTIKIVIYNYFDAGMRCHNKIEMKIYKNKHVRFTNLVSEFRIFFWFAVAVLLDIYYFQTLRAWPICVHTHAISQREALSSAYTPKIEMNQQKYIRPDRAIPHFRCIIKIEVNGCREREGENTPGDKMFALCSIFACLLVYVFV